MATTSARTLPRLLEQLGRYSTDVIVIDRVMRLVRHELGNASIADTIDDPDRTETTWILLAQLGG